MLNGRILYRKNQSNCSSFVYHELNALLGQLGVPRIHKHLCRKQPGSIINSY